MHGLADIITVVMVEEVKKNIISFFKDDTNKKRKYFYIAMLAIIAIIAIVFYELIKENNRNVKTSAEVQNIVIGPSDDKEVYKLITEYFKARTDLNYPKIFSAFGRDYYKEEREDKDGSFKKIIDSIRYERIFVKGYDNISIYTTKGYYEGDILCIVTYDLALGFTSDVAPMIIIFYLEKNDDKLIIKNNIDVGISKYIIEISNQPSVVDLYNSVYSRLNRVLISNENLRLTYNSLRQYEMNMNQDFGPLNKMEIIENAKVKTIDPVEDAYRVQKEIIEQKEEESIEKRLDDYLERVVASLSDIQKLPPGVTPPEQVPVAP